MNCRTRCNNGASLVLVAPVSGPNSIRWLNCLRGKKRVAQVAQNVMRFVCDAKWFVPLGILNKTAGQTTWKIVVYYTSNQSLVVKLPIYGHNLATRDASTIAFCKSVTRGENNILSVTL